jgi:NAD(P)-dependent dehydrogenase (short-subunit alcohol dehydrogenase family)
VTTKSLFDLRGKVALITGSTRGIGKSMVEELARAGAKVVVSSRDAQACKEVAKELEAHGSEVLAQPCDVSRKEQLKALTDATIAKWGCIDIVVANAAANHYGPSTEIPDEDFDRVFLSNVKSVLWLAALTLPGMAARGGGAFIAVGSIGGIIANPTYGAYCMSKAAAHHLVRNLAAEWGPKNIRVNAIAPGLIKTDFSRGIWEDEPRLAARLATTPLRRVGAPSEIGGVAVFLASDAASFVTGQTIVADGGVTIL